MRDERHETIRDRFIGYSLTLSFFKTVQSEKNRQYQKAKRN